MFKRFMDAAELLRPRGAADGGTSAQRKAAIHLVGRGKNLYNTKRYTEAAELFRQAIAEDPGYARAHCYFGNTLHKLGSPEEAVMEWKKAVIVEPDSDSAAKAQAKLDKVSAQNQEVTRSLEESLGLHKQGL
jgi:tetratricopeptide (TPR) repeat protein